MAEQNDYFSPSLFSLEKQESRDTYYIPKLQQTIEAGEYSSERDIEINALKKMAGKNNNAFLMGMRNLDEPVSLGLFDGYVKKKTEERMGEFNSSAWEATKAGLKGFAQGPVRFIGYAATNSLPLIARTATTLYAMSGAAGGLESADKWLREANKGIEAWENEIKRATGIDDASEVESIVGNAIGSVWGSVAIGGTVGKAAVAPMFGVSALQDTYVRQREAGTGMGESLVRGAIHGTAETALESLQLNRIFGNLAKKSKPIAIVKDLFENALQEGTQQGAELATNWNIDNRELSEKLQEVGVAIVGGAVASLAGSVGGNILNRKTIDEVGDLMKKTGHTEEEIKTVKENLNKIVDTDELQQAANQVAKDELTTIALSYKEQAQAASEAIVVGLEDTIKRNELVDMGGALSGDKTEGMPPLYQLGDIQIDTQKNPNIGMVLYQADQEGKPMQTLGQVLAWTKSKLNVEQAKKMNTGINAVYNKTYEQLKAFGQEESVADANARVRSAMAYSIAKNYDVGVEQADTMLGGIVQQKASEFGGQGQAQYQDVAERINEIDAEEQEKGVPEYTAPTININGVERQTTNSDGDPIARSEKSLRYFYNWFGDSKVVDEQGRPLVMWHATNKTFETFNMRKASGYGKAFGFGQYFTNDEEASEEYGEIKMPVYLSLENPFIIKENVEDVFNAFEVIGLDKKEMIKKYGDYQDPFKITESIFEYEDASKKIRKRGYDGIVYNNGEINVAFDPNQIKSTSNRGTYSLTEDNIYYQMAGKMAKTANVGARQEAEKMSKEGKNPTEIWEKTMWMLDKDGKWKFEIDDSGAKIISSEDLKKYEESVPSNRQLSELYARRDELELKGLQGTKQYKDVQKKLDELMKKSFVFEHTTTLGELLDHKKLYEAYPELKTKRVTFKKLKDGVGGSYSYAENAFNLDESMALDEEEMLSTLLHEIQHYIQRVEDFARGGSPEEFTKEVMEQIKEKEREIFEKNRTNNYIKALQKYVTREQAIEIVDKYKELNDALIKELESSDEVSDDLSERVEKELNSLLKKYGISEEQAKEAFRYNEGAKRNDAIQSIDDPDSFYNRLLGEIEARSTQKRMHLTEEQRRALPPFVDREYAGEEIIADNKGGIVIQPKENTLFQDETSPRGAYYKGAVYLFENANESTFVHEMAHSYMYVLERLANGGNAQAQNDLNVIRKWLGKKQGEAFTQADWERFARGFEMYMREGKSPNEYLGGEKGVFARFRDWLMHIYTGIKSIKVKNEKGKEEPVNINSQIKRFYDEMLGGQDIDKVFDTAEKNQQSLEVLDSKLKQLAEAQQKLAEEKAKLVREMANNVKPDTAWANVKDWGKNVWESAKELPTNVLQSSYERLAKIDARLGLLVQRAEQSQGLRIKKWADQIQPFYESFNKLSNEDKAKVQYFLLNQQWGDVEDILGKEGTEAVHKVLEEIYNELVDSGVEVGYQDNYFPRAVLDYDGLLQEMGLTYPSLRKEMEEALGKDATPQEQAEWLDKHIMGFKGSVSLNQNRNTKERKLDLITDRMAKYYKPSMETLVDYMGSMAKLLSMREAFGRDIEYKESTAEESIGKIINRLFGNNELSKKEIDEVRDVLSALYLPNGIGNKFLQAMRQYGYATKLSYSTTVRQFADVGMMMKVNGVLNTLDALFHPDKRITLENLGIDPLGEEFQTSKKDIGGKIANIATKWKGINWADAIMKNAFMRGNYNALQKLAKTPDKFHEKYDRLFGDETDTLIKDLNDNKISEPVRVLLFHEISKIQPISRSAMPTAYLQNPNGRVFYMFKTFSLHRAEYMVSELAEDFRKGDLKKAGKDIMADVAVIGWEGLVELLIAFLKYGWQALAAKEVIETFAGSGLGVLGLNKHQALQISRGQVGDFFQEMVGVGTPLDDIGYMIRHYDDEDKLLRAFLPDMILEPLIAGPKPLGKKKVK